MLIVMSERRWWHTMCINHRGEHRPPTAVRRLIARWRLPSNDMRPTEDERRNGWTAPIPFWLQNEPTTKTLLFHMIWLLFQSA